jgi:hypothetical protein
METQPASANVSMLSQMNAFYGNPNLSQETTTAVFRGAEAPEVYTQETPEAQNQQAQETDASPNPVEDYFSQTTEQLEISEQAAALQQQQGNEAPANQVPFGANEGATPPETLAPSPESEVGAPLQVEQAPQNVPSEIGETKESSPPTQPPQTEATAVSALNESPTPEPQTASANNQQPENNPLQQSYGQFGAGGPAASNASQPGAIFSARG